MLIKPALPILNSAHPLANGLISGWVVTESTSTVFRDYSPKKLHGTVGGGVSITNDRYGKSLLFANVSNSFVAYNNHPDPVLPITIVCRFKPSTLIPIGLFDTAPSTSNALHQFAASAVEWHNNNPRVTFTIPAINVWYDMVSVFSFDGNRQLKVYLNGVLSGSGTGTTSSTFTWTNFRIGDINGGSFGRFEGRIDHVLVYSGRAWTAKDAARHHAYPYDVFQPLAFYYPAIATVGTVPLAPSSLNATPVSTSEINLTWADNSGDETGFKIERSPDGIGSWVQIDTVAENVTSYNDTGLTESTTYYYRVRAYNVVGNSAYSNITNATTNSAFIYQPRPGSAVYNGIIIV